MQEPNGAERPGWDGAPGTGDAFVSTLLPVLPTVHLAARCSPVDHDHAGDWFDVEPLPDGRVALVVGSVGGRGAAATAAMARLRAVVAELLIETTELSATLARIDRLAARESELRAASLCLAALDPVREAVEYATCGHPPPLLVDSAGRARAVAPSGAGPLGTRSPIRISTHAIAPDEVLLLHTDAGLPGRMRGVDPALLGGSAVDRLCDVSAERRNGPGRQDGVTVLAAQVRRPPAAPLTIQVPATVEGSRELRRALADWLIELGAGAREISALELAIGEITANVVDHAYPPDMIGDLRVHAELDRNGMLRVDISDDGVWREPQAHPPTRGRGLWLAGEMVDELYVSRGDGDPRRGTVVSLRHRLRRDCGQPDTVPGATMPDKKADAADGLALRVERVGEVIRVCGPVDATTAPALAEMLNRFTRGGVHPLSIDLSAVPNLGGAGIRVLFELRDRLRGHGHHLIVRATPGTHAYDVLELAGLAPAPPAGSE